jgi:capsular polysaccharide biosynthesis protein
MKRKELILLVFALSLVVSYTLIFFLIEEQYEATAILIPRRRGRLGRCRGTSPEYEDTPVGDWRSKSGRSDMDLYNTVIFSRTVMEDVIREFGLLQAYRLDTSRVDAMELAVKRLRKEISTRATEESAFELTVRAGRSQRASDMANYVIHRMNERIVDLNTGRSRENREFLGRRVEDISAHLKAAEDSLRDISGTERSAGRQNATAGDHCREHDAGDRAGSEAVAGKTSWSGCTTGSRPR